jgi:hypothetical protein
VREQLLRLRGLVFHPAVLALCTDLVLLGYGAFTLVSQLTALAGGSPRVLLPALIAIAAASLAVLWFVFERTPAWFDGYLAEVSAVPAPSAAAFDPRSALVIGASLLAMFVCALVAGPWLAWIPCALCAAWLAARALRTSPLPAPAPAAEPWWAVGVVYACGLVGLALALLVVRPRSDDAFYLSMARSVFDAPDLPLLAVNGIHGPANEWLGLQRMFPPYRVHSFEVFGGALSQLTRIDPALMFHLVLGPLLSFFAPFAIARALRMLTPAWWLGLCAVIALYCIEGSASVGYANHAFVRMFHGKSVLLTAGVPLLIVHGLRFGQRPSWIRFVFLVLAQSAAVGLSSTAIWLAPIVSMVAVWAGTPAREQLLRRSLAAAGSSVYVLALGLWVFAALNAAQREAVAVDELAAKQRQGQAAVTAAGPAQNSVPAAPPAAQPEPAAKSAPEGGRPSVPKPSASAPPVATAQIRLAEAVETALGSGRSAFGLLALLALALALARSLEARRLFSWLALCAAVFAAPFANDLISRFVTGISTYHRLFWLLPIPLALGVASAELFSAARERLGPPRALALALAVVAGLLALSTQRLVISEANHARLVYPLALKIGPRARGAALAVCSHVGRGDYVLASSSVSEQIATLRNCGHPLLTVARWMRGPQDEIQAREELARYVGSPDDVPLERAQWFLTTLARYRPKVVVTLEEAMKNRRMKLLLRWAGYEKMEQVEGNHVWVTLSSFRKSEYARVAADICQKVAPGAVVFASFGVSRALEARGCVAPLYRSRAVYDASVDRVAQFERLLSSETELLPAEAEELRQMLARERVAMVVVAPLGMGNGALRVLLRDLEFRNLRGKGGHRTFIAPAAK